MSNAYMKKIITLSDNNQVSAVFVPSCSPETGKVYTTGLSPMGRYDVMIDNVSLVRGAEIIESVLGHIYKFGVNFEPAYLYGLLHRGRLLSLLPLNSAPKEDVKLLGKGVYDDYGDYRVSQIVFPNRDNQFPWERSFNKNVPIPHKIYANIGDKRITTMEVVGITD